MKALYPLRLTGVTKSPIWGGTALLRDWKKTSVCSTVGESWELTVRRDEVCRITNGRLAGCSLAELIRDYGKALTGFACEAENFPLLIKLIDAQDSLSVQVHPDDAYASRVENDRGKTEMWYIVDADAGAELICGLADGVGKEELTAAVQEGRIETALQRRTVKPGEVYFIPAGLAHAIGKGILIAEIQQNSDLTYRVFDYNRRDREGRLRELHIEKALDVIRPFSDDEINAIRYARTGGVAESPEVLADCTYFRVEKRVLEEQASVISQAGVMRHLLCLAGEAVLEHEGVCYRVSKGDSWLLPAELTEVRASGDATLLITRANMN